MMETVLACLAKKGKREEVTIRFLSFNRTGPVGKEDSCSLTKGDITIF